MNNAVSNATQHWRYYNYNLDIINDNLQTINAKIISFSGLDVTSQSRVDNAKTILCIQYGICNIDGIDTNYLNVILEYIAT